MPSYKDLNVDYQGGDLYIEEKIDLLDGCPEHITGSFYSNNNEVISLVGGPEKVDGDYVFSWNHLTDLVGCASHIGRELNCTFNNITSLVGIHKIIKSCKVIYFDVNKIKQGGIGLLMIANLTRLLSTNFSPLTEPFKIIEKYLGTGTKGMMACSKELTEKGYEDYAKL